MKKALIFLLIGVIFLILLGLFIFKMFSAPTKQPTQQQTTFPISTAINQQDQSSIEIQQEQRAFKNKIINTDQITLGKAKIIAPYAIQDWSDENKAGEALLKYDSQSGWELITMGGGAWDVPSLVDAGVPESIARQLMGE